MTALPDEEWRTSGRCANGDCVEVAFLGGEVAVRDSKEKSRHGPVLRFTVPEWSAFLAAARAGEFDFPIKR